MLPRLLVDTHTLVRWFFEGRKLSRNQVRLLKSAVQHGEPLAFSAISLMEIAALTKAGKLNLKKSLHEFFDDLESNPEFTLLPLSYEVAEEAGCLLRLHDPADCIIVATARVHGLRLVTSDQRIIDSKLVTTIE